MTLMQEVENDIVYVAAAMHMKRRPEYWQKRIIDKL